MTVPRWAREYFEYGYAQRWGLPPVSDRIRLETDGLWNQLRLTEGAWVLDLGCGHGRHALALAQRGAKIAGLDFAETLLMRAKGLGADLGVPAHWLRGDMRRLPLRSAFFAGAILIDAFGFFETDEENEAVLGEIGRVLAPGGRLGLKVVNGAPVLAAFRATDREEREGTVVTISRQLAPESARMIERVIVKGPHGNGEYERHQRLYRPDELSATLERSGFSGVELFASSDCAAFEPATSQTMWVFSQRGASANEQHGQ
jgi:ubiquinone/menaquinone biosynthesis C-methylase UbiE